MIGFKKHVFVCLNERAADHPTGSCKHRGAEAIFLALKKGVSDAGLQDQVRINRAGCLDHCAYGPSVVIYPEASWYHVPTAEDAMTILRQHVIEGKVVHELLMENIP